MRRVFFILTYILNTLFSTALFAQESSYSQVYSSPLHINPAFTGSNQKTNTYIQFRDQWPQLDGSYSMISFSADHAILNYNSGVGIIIHNETAGSSHLQTIKISPSYAYMLDINDDFHISLGLSPTIQQSSIDQSRLVFEDQIQDNFIISENTSEPLDLSTKTNLNFASGAIAFFKSSWIGTSIYQLGNNGVLEKKPIIHFQTGTQITFVDREGFELGDVQKMMLSSNLSYQGDFGKLIVGSQYIYQPLIIGVSYVNIPLNTLESNLNMLSFLVGYYNNIVKIGYSYDYVLNNQFQLGGAHEISIGISFKTYTNNRKKSFNRKKSRKIICPKF